MAWLAPRTPGHAELFKTTLRVSVVSLKAPTASAWRASALKLSVDASARAHDRLFLFSSAAGANGL